MGELEDGVPIKVVVDALLGGEENVRDGEDLVGAVVGEPGVCVQGQLGEAFRSHEIAGGQELRGDRQGPLRLRPVRPLGGIHFFSFLG